MRHLITFQYIEAIIRAGSIRKAAEDMNITASALNRRIQRFEEEFGSEIFERLPRGVRLNPAGELLIRHARVQETDLKRVQDQVADLSGERRGHVSIACSQALVPYFLPEQIALYRREHPGVTFTVNVRDREAAEKELSDFKSDIALVFEPMLMAEFQVQMIVPQPIYIVLREDHPLAKQDVVRLRECLEYPHVLPASQYGVRFLLEAAIKGGSRNLSPIIESDSFDFMRHYVIHEDAIAFQIPIGLQLHQGLVERQLSTADVPAGNLLLGQMRGRTLPVASARFMQQLEVKLHSIL